MPVEAALVAGKIKRHFMQLTLSPRRTKRLDLATLLQSLRALLDCKAAFARAQRSARPALITL